MSDYYVKKIIDGYDLVCNSAVKLYTVLEEFRDSAISIIGSNLNEVQQRSWWSIILTTLRWYINEGVVSISDINPVIFSNLDSSKNITNACVVMLYCYEGIVIPNNGKILKDLHICLLSSVEKYYMGSYSTEELKSDIDINKCLELSDVNTPIVIGGSSLVSEDIRLVDMLCKHVMSLRSDKSKSVYKLSNILGYNQVMWGYTSGMYKNPDSNRVVHLHTISKMIYKKFRRPFRVVIDHTGVLWADNLHSVIRDILVYGEEIRLKDVPHYTVDLSSDLPRVFGSISNCIEDIRGAVSVAYARVARTSNEIRELGYTIGEFMKDNNITRESVGAAERHYKST